MKITVITGSPRKGGNSFLLADAFIREASAKGADVTRFDAAFMDIQPCRGCEACARTGECVTKDEFIPILDEMMNADAIVLVSPVYWYGFPAQIKVVFDRMYAPYLNEKTFAGKRCALIACCNSDAEVTFSGMKFGFQKSFELMGAEIVDGVFVTGVQDKGAVKETDGLARAAELADRIVEGGPARDAKQCQYQMYQGK